MGSVSMPLWLFYGLFLGGMLPSVFGGPLWTMLAGMAMGAVLCWALDRHLRRGRKPAASTTREEQG
jgi:hypothetical protein